MKRITGSTARMGVAIAVVAGMGAVGHRVEAKAPAGRYSTSGNGTVVDTQTGLVWQQGSPAVLPYTSAVSYCTNNTAGLPGTGWRLPDVRELETIVDETQVNPSIDGAAFPGTASAFFWAGPTAACCSTYAWGVAFDEGGTSLQANSSTYNVRCVH